MTKHWCPWEDSEEYPGGCPEMHPGCGCMCHWTKEEMGRRLWSACKQLNVVQKILCDPIVMERSKLH